ncbi:MAG: KPN_02809 family neutral zinc metallopeptidase [Marmoricola sp.]
MRFNPKARIDRSQVENRAPGGTGGGYGGSGFRLPVPSGGGGRVGAGTVVIIVIYLLVQFCASNGTSSDPGQGDPALSGGTGTTGSAGVPDRCRTGADANRSLDCATDLLTNSIQDFWSRAYPQQTGKRYDVIRTVKFSGQTSSGCGTAQSAMGPFYCPNDQLVYIDRSFMHDMLQGQLGAKGGPFALAYVLAHEYGHHIEDQLGVLRKLRTQQGASSDSVRLELMADCLAGVWAKSATTTKDASGQVLITDLTQDDISRAIDAAQAVGDDRIQQESGGRVDRESWTHGSSAQRVHWFETGLQGGTIQGCDTFDTDKL